MLPRGTAPASSVAGSIGQAIMSSGSENLRPELDQAQRALGDALKDACSMNPKNANTGELILIDELLASAGESAKNAISVRRRLRRDATAGDAGAARRK